MVKRKQVKDDVAMGDADEEQSDVGASIRYRYRIKTNKTTRRKS